MSGDEPRKKLAAYLAALIEGEAWADTGKEAAEHIVTVLGWRPSARVLETADELDALPDGTIIRSRYGTAAQRTEDAWEFPNEVGRCLGEIIDLPVIVLYEPEEAQR